MQIEVQPVERSAMKDVFSTDAFLDSDDKGEVASVQKLTVKETVEVKQDDDDDDDGNESEESEESDSDSDSSDDDDEKPSKKSSKNA